MTFLNLFLFKMRKVNIGNNLLIKLKGLSEKWSLWTVCEVDFLSTTKKKENIKVNAEMNNKSSQVVEVITDKRWIV